MTSHLSSVPLNAAGPLQNSRDFIYSVSITPTMARISQGDFGTFNVILTRGEEAGQFSVDLSLTPELSPLLKSYVTFDPAIINLEEGQKIGHSVMRINSQGLQLGAHTLRIQATVHSEPPRLPSSEEDRAVSAPVTLVIRAGEAADISASSPVQSEQSGSSVSDAPLTGSTDSLTLSSRTKENQEAKTNTKPNSLPPVARGGHDQTVREGDKVVLDGSASTVPDKDILSISWEQSIPRQPSVKLDTLGAPSRVGFIAPDVDRDTLFRFNLNVRDSDGVQATDSVNVLVRNIPSSSTGQGQPLRTPETGSDNKSLSSSPTSIEESTLSGNGENHAPTAETLQTVFTNAGNPLSISLNGKDSDKDDSVLFAIVSEPSRGTIAGFEKTTGLLTYVPPAGFTGQDRLSFKVVDNHGAESNVGSVLIKANSAGQPSSSSPNLPSTTSSSQSNGTSAPSTSPVLTNGSGAKNNPRDNNQISTNFTVPSNKAGTNITTLASTVKSPIGNTSQQNETLRSFAASSIAAGEVYGFVKDCTGSGTPFSSPHAVDVDSSGNLYVLDTGRNRVQVFNADCTFIRQWGSQGAGNGQFSSPQGISVSPSGNVYVVDTGNNRVQKFTSTGGFLLSWGGKGTGNGQFDTPVEIDHDSAGNSYVADANNKRIVKSLDGQFMAKWSGAGQGQGQIKGPHGIAVDSANFVYVTDNVNNELLKFTNTGGFIKSIAGLNNPHGVTADSQNSIYLAERGANKVKKFDSDLNLLTEFGSGPGSTPGVFNGPDGITVSSTGKVYVTDIGNNKVQLWRLAPSITLTADTSQPKWDHQVKITVRATNFGSTDKISIVWGDGTPATEVTPIPQSGIVDVTHVYGVASLSTNPNNIVGKVQNSAGEDLTTSQPVTITVQKHVTALTLDLKPSEAPQCANCPIYVIGKLIDPDSVPPNQGISGKTIALSGSGVSNLANPAKTRGVVFTGTSSANLTLSNSGVLQMPAGSQISLPAGSHGVAFKFRGAVDVTFTKGNDQTVNFDDVSSLDYDVADGIKKITINSAGDLETFSVRDFAVDGNDDHQIFVNFGSGTTPAGSYSTLEVGQGTYLSGGTTQTQDGSELKIVAAFNAPNDLAYLGATSSEISYDVSRAAGVGEGTVTAYSGVGWTKLSVGTATDGDMCTSVVGGVKTASGDADKDGICDKFEAFPAGASDTTNNAFISCPTTLSGTTTVAMDLQCPNTSASIKYNLCFSDQFASAWAGNTDGKRVCPRPNHKDLYVEIDYMQGHQPDAEAIKRVIRAFGNAPFSNTGTDAFGRSGGITLHVVVSDQFTRVAPFHVWQESVDDGNSNNDFRHVKEAIFGTAAERGGTSGMPGMTAAAWTSTGDTLKHYVYHYGQWISYYGGTCADNTILPADADSIVDGLSSGLAESLGNDFIVSLGCGFNGGVDSSGNVATKLGSLGTIDEQAGTFMHELGHNLNLGHGGALTLAIGSANYNMNCKPNYFSVMNYARQLPNAVLDQNSWEAGFNYGGPGPQTSLDYARGTSSPTDLSESAVSETTGITSSDGKQYWVMYGTPGKSPDARKALTGTNFDFDGNGAISAGTVIVDLSFLSPTVGGCGPIPGQTLKSFSDWDKVNLVFSPDGDSQDGVTQRGSIPGINENTRELKPVFLQAISEDIQTLFIPPPNPDGSSTFNTGSNVPLKFDLKDKNGNFITNAVVTLVAQKGSTTITGSTPFTFKQGHYQYNWVTPSGASGAGEWTLKYVMNLGSPNASVLPGPFATGQYTLKITGLK